MIITVQGNAEKHFRIYYEYDNDSIPLGQGGMGIVYEGTCHKVDNPSEFVEVAIKKVTTSDPDLIERAKREASIQLNHPNLVRMYGFIPNLEIDPYTRNERTNYYVAMERLTGINLDAVLNGMITDKRGQVMTKARQLQVLLASDRCGFVKTVMLPILAGVQALHDAGYIHRDIDPSNVMIMEDGSLKLIDFGIAKKVSSLGSNSHLTQTGAIIGKPEYAAPELITGDVKLHNVTTDIYSLGIMMFQFYTGYLPFVGDRNQIMKAQMKDPIPVKDIDHKGIRSIIKKATQKNQAKRYQRVADMIADLEKISDTRNVFTFEDEEAASLSNSPFDENLVAPSGQIPSVSVKLQEPVVPQEPVSPQSFIIPEQVQDSGNDLEESTPLPEWLLPALVVSGLLIGCVCGILFPLGQYL